ncbi:TIMELESS-interacting protein [Ambystoma mexicanum]|uniref:TIMELESS-interacting protein n=1 Tax=Ambystoma mexicanum TaxID=8296 RepID=UPI0037E80E3B
MTDPMENSLFDIPDYEHTKDEAFAAFPPPLSPGGGGEQMANGMDDWDGNRGSPPAEEPPKPTRKTVKRNIPKLDADRLVSDRGLPALRTMFNDTKFKGKGHEADDLKLLMRHMEHWAHRLYPKLGFEDFINKLEALGAKKPVQTCLKRIRMDLPIVHEDFTSREEVAPEGLSNGVNMPSNDFDMHLPPQDYDEPYPESMSVKASFPPPSQSNPFLSEDQRLRIERNKQLALERRMAKIQNSQSQDLSLSSAPVHIIAEVKTRDAEENLDDKDAEFLDALVAAAAQTEDPVMVGMDDAGKSAVVDLNIVQAFTGTTAKHNASACDEAARTEETASDVHVKDAAENVLEGAADADSSLADADVASNETATSSEILRADLVAAIAASSEGTFLADVEESVNKVTAYSKMSAIEDVTDAAIDMAATNAETTVTTVLDPAVGRTVPGDTTCTKEITKAFVEAATISIQSVAGIANTASSDMAAPDFSADVVHVAVDTFPNGCSLMEAPTERNPPPGVEDVSSVKDALLQNTEGND